MDLWEPPDQHIRREPPLCSVMQAWQQPSGHGAAGGKDEPPLSPATEAPQQPRGSCPQAKPYSAQASPRLVKRRQHVPKADKATEITPSFEAMLKRRAASRRREKSVDKGYGRTRPRRSTAHAPSYPKQSFSRAPRMSKALNNLYMHLYEEVGEHEPWAVQRVEGLPKACMVFSALRNGRIHVNDLLLTLHALGILVTSTEMRQVLKAIDIDANGNLVFTDFLDVLKETSPFAQTEAFQNTYQAFSRMRKGLIAVDDLQPSLLCLGVGLSLETLQEALKHVYVTKDKQLNVWDFLMAVSDLEHQYEDVESLGLYDTLKPKRPGRALDSDAKARARRRTRFSFDVKYLQKADAPQLDSSSARSQKAPRAGKQPSCPRPRFLSFQEKLPSRLDAEGSPEETPRAPKRRLTRQKPPWSTSIEEDIEEPLEDTESPFAQQRSHKTRQFTAAKEPAGVKEPGVASAGGQRVPDSEALQDASEIVNKIKADTMEVAELRGILQTMGIPFTDQEFQEVLQKVTLEKDGTVSFDCFLAAAANTRRFSEFSALKGAVAAVSKVQGDRVAASDLLSWLRDMGIHVSDAEFQQALEQVSVDANGKVNVRAFMEVLSKSPRLCQLLAVQEALRVVKHVKEDEVEASRLDTSLRTLGLRLASDVIGQVLQSAHVDGAGRVKFADFMTALSRSQHFILPAALQEASSILSKLEGEKISVQDLQTVLSYLTVRLSGAELADVLQLCPVDDSGRVNLSDFIRAVTSSRRFAESVGLQLSCLAISTLQDDHFDLHHLESTLTNMGLRLAKETLAEVMKVASADDHGKVNFREFIAVLTQLPHFPDTTVLKETFDALSSMKDASVRVDALGSTLASVGIVLTEEELRELLASVAIAGDGMVQFKDVLVSMTGTRRLTEFEALQDAFTALSKISGDKIEVSSLPAALKALGIQLTPEELQEALPSCPADGSGRVNVQEFMRLLSRTPRVSGSAALQAALETVNRIKEEKVPASQLEQMLNSLGVHVAKESLLEGLKAADGDGKVNFEDFLTSLANPQNISELEAVQGALDVVSRVEDDKMEVSHLESALAGMGITLPKGELEEALRHATVDGDGKVNFNDFLKGLTSTKRFSRTLEMEGAVRAIGAIKEDTVDVHHLESIMRNMGIHLTPSEIELALKHVACEEDGKVDLKDFMTALTKSRRFSQAETDRVDVRNLDSILDSMGIYLTNTELQEVLKQVAVDADGKVYLSKFLKGVRALRRFSHGEGKRVDVRDLDALLAEMGMHLTQEELQEVLKHVSVDGDGKVSVSGFTKSVISTRRASQAESESSPGDRVATSHLDSILGNLGIFLTEEELQAALKHTEIDAEGKVNLSDFMKSVQRLTEAAGEKVDVKNLNSILASMGLPITEKEIQKALGSVARSADGKVDLKHFLQSVLGSRRPSQCETDGKVNLGEFMKGVKTVQKLPPSEGDKVDAGSLGSELANLGIHLTPEELQEALQRSPADRDGRVSLGAFLKSVTSARRPSQAERDRVDTRNLDCILAHMGIYLTNEELQEALKLATVDADGKVNLSEFMRGVSAAQPSTQGSEEKVNVRELDSILASLGICAADEELQAALTHTTVSEAGTVNLTDFLRALNATRCHAKARKEPQTTETRMTLKSLPKKMILKPDPKKASRELSGILLDRSKCKTAKSLTRDQLEAFHRAYNFFSKDADGNIDRQGLKATAKKLGIDLTEQEADDELLYADIDGDGKVNFSDFLTIVSDNKRFIQAVAPEKGSTEDVESIDATGILMFEILSKLVELSALPRKAMLEIVSYYRQKFMASTGRRALIDDSNLMDRGKSRHTFRHAPQKGKVTPQSAFAGAARISVMNNKELEAYVETLKASTAPSDSPYAQVPIFPLLPNRDGMTEPKPKKDLQKLEMQRRKEPISSFENHFFHKRNWLRKAAAFKPPGDFKGQKIPLSLSPHLMERRHQLTIDDLQEIRLDVKRVTEMYKEGMALKERNRMLRLWQKLHGGQIGLKPRNNSFYHTFSTYTWSWNTRQELVTPNQLQEYDNKLYHREQSSACSDDSEVKDGTRNGKERK
ncbi:EF-hand calcium-binding domain-containing protein 3 isoform X4 [Pelodiscus sinensis]|uniref:EF-hand calcium-binding domain-containing protein 3 isoform X4 n=1 Tax=Pelodiscus sinensis TaxID=13735 RepID=UPI003F6BB6BF